MATGTNNLQILMLRGQSAWVVQCLEHDIIAQGRTIDEAMERFHRVLSAEIFRCLEEGIEPLSDIKPAREGYWNLYNTKARKLIVGEPADISPDTFGANRAVPSIPVKEVRAA